MVDCLKKNLKRFSIYAFVIMGIGVASYLPLIARGLTNTYDGLWQETYFQAGNWELSIGRWAWPFLDKFRGGYAAEPFNSLLTLLLMTTASLIIISTFGMHRYCFRHALIMLLNPTVCCFLSYRYMSPTFGMSVLLSSIAGCALTRNFSKRKSNILLCIICSVALAVSLGLYQANVGCFCAIVVIYALYQLLEDHFKDCLNVLLKGAIVGIVGCIIYKILWDVALALRYIVAADYKGAGSVSIIDMITSLPRGILQAYKSYVIYFSFFQSNYVFRIIRIAIVFGLLILTVAVGIKKLKHNKGKLCLYIVLLLLTPVAINFFHLLAPNGDGLMLQMTGSSVIYMVLLMCLLEKTASQRVKTIVVTFSLLILYGNVYATGTDIDAMSQGTVAAQSLMENVNITLVKEDLFDLEYNYAFVGRMSDNPLFKTNELWDKASHYARFGEFWYTPDCLTYSYRGLVNSLGLNIDIVDENSLKTFFEDENVKRMPVYPSEGSIEKLDDTIIIKISDKY